MHRQIPRPITILYLKIMHRKSCYVPLFPKTETHMLCQGRMIVCSSLRKWPPSMQEITNAKYARITIRISSSGNLLPNSANLYRLLKYRGPVSRFSYYASFVQRVHADPPYLPFVSTKSRSWPQLDLKAVQPLEGIYLPMWQVLRFKLP
jgi:hypothetical protein